MTIKDLEKKIAKHQAEIADLTAKIAAEESAADKYAEAAEAAAVAGNVEEYRANKNAEQNARDIAFVLNTQLERMDRSASREDILAAWADYCADYGKKFDTMYKKMETARKEYEDLFMSIVDGQSEALGIRESLGAMMGIDMPAAYITGEEAYPGIPMPALFPLDYNQGVNVRGCSFSRDAAHYIMSHDTWPNPNPVLEKLNTILKLHRAFK